MATNSTTTGYLLLTNDGKNRYFVRPLEDGSLFISKNGVTEYEYAASMIENRKRQMHVGKAKVIEDIIEQAKRNTVWRLGKESITVAEFNKYLDDVWEYNKNRAKREAQAAQERADRKHKAAAKILNQRLESGVLESNAENIYLLLTYLNTQNWGGWELPTMTIGYSCNQYDCDGKTATTISLDEPIEYNEKMVSKFEVGAPHGHLMGYVKMRCEKTADEIAAVMKEF